MVFYTASIECQLPHGEMALMGLSLESGVGGQTATQVIADHVKDQFVANWGAISGQFSNKLKWTRVIAYKRPKTQPSHAEEVAESLISGGQPGQSSNPTLPPETAIVVSLITAQPGRSHRGRMYLPAPTDIVLDDTGRLTTAKRDLFATWAGDFFGDLNTVGDTCDVVVWSRLKAATYNVTRIRVGDQLDTQRRRQNSIPESYKELAISGT